MAVAHRSLMGALEETIFDISGRRVSAFIAGRGRPTVVFESGLGDGAHSWHAVQERVSSITRTLSYSRAGYGNSESGPMPRTAGAIVQELHAVLTRNGDPPPYVLVGHSFGGMIVRLFANTFVEDVAGLVLVDGSHEDQTALHPPAFRALLRSLVASHYDAALQRGELTRAEYDTARSEYEHFASTSAAELRATRRSYGDIPVRILCAGRSLTDVFGDPDNLDADERGEYERMSAGHIALAQSLTSLSTCATLRVLPSSGHYIQRDDPEAVFDAIRDVVASVRGN